MVIDEKLNLKNFLHDAMDFHAVRQLMVKSRHKILMPTLVLHLTKSKLKQGGEYRSSFARNLHERTDRPVFTVEDAVNQLKAVDPSKTEIEKAMDDFFVAHLPKEIIDEGGEYQNNELDEDAMRRQMKLEKQKTKKYATHAQLANDSLGNLRNSPDADSHPLKKRKSDLTLAFVDSSEQVAKLA